jgi:hypothetical protein
MHNHVVLTLFVATISRIIWICAGTSIESSGRCLACACANHAALKYCCSCNEANTQFTFICPHTRFPTNGIGTTNKYRTHKQSE